MQIYTVFDFGRDFHTETLNELGFYYWPYIILAIAIVIAFIFLFLLPGISLAITLLIVAPIGMFQFSKANDAHQQYDQHFNEMVRTAYLEHKQEIDKGIEESLAKHDLTRNEVCNQSTVLDGIERKPIDVNKTLLCGTDADSALPGMFILNDHDTVVHVGESDGEIVVVYDPEDNQ